MAMTVPGDLRRGHARRSFSRLVGACAFALLSTVGNAAQVDLSAGACPDWEVEGLFVGMPEHDALDRLRRMGMRTYRSEKGFSFLPPFHPRNDGPAPEIDGHVSLTDSKVTRFHIGFSAEGIGHTDLRIHELKERLGEPTRVDSYDLHSESRMDIFDWANNECGIVLRAERRPWGKSSRWDDGWIVSVSVYPLGEWKHEQEQARRTEEERIRRQAEDRACSPQPVDSRYVDRPPVRIVQTRTHLSYPKKARRKGIEGRVVARYVVEKDGTVGQIELVEVPDPDLGFSDALIDVLRQSRYEPALCNGEPVAAWGSYTADFKLSHKK